MEFFKSEKISESLIKITDIAGVAAFLVIGEKEVALLDTGCGIGNMKDFIKHQTNLPATVICTHGHADHAGGTFGFENVYLNEKDFELSKHHTSELFRKEYLETVVSPGIITTEIILPQRHDGYKKLENGQVFDLGGITLEAIELPGHTQGMTCILICELRTLLLGDACNTATFIFMEESSTVEQYKNELQKFLSHSVRYDTVLFSHGHNKGSKSIIKEGIDLCDEVLAGLSDNKPFEFMGQKALIAKEIIADFSRVDGKTFNMVFNPNKIFNLKVN